MIEPHASTFMPGDGRAGAVREASLGTTRMALEMPAQSAILPPSFVASGWALDPDATAGTGVDAVQIYAYPNFGSGETPIALGDAQYGTTRSDIGAQFGGQFVPSGFRLPISGLAVGSYRLFAFAHNVAANGFTAYVFVDVRVSALSAVAIDSPADGTTSTSAFEVAGWTLDNRAASGIGVDAVHVYAAPHGGADPPVFLGVASLGWTRNDVAAAFGAQFAASGYHFTVTGMPPGGYVLYVYAHSTVTNSFSLVAARAVTVNAATLLSIDAPSAESAIDAPSFGISGWAFDRNATNGSGIDTLHVYAYPNPGSGQAPIFLGVATVGLGRADIASAYGSQYGNSGYVLNVDASPAGLSPGVYDIVVWAHSSVANAFTAGASVRVRIP